MMSRGSRTSEKYALITGRTLALMTQRFWPRVRIPLTGDCWEWTGTCGSNYGVVAIPGVRWRTVYAHVFAFFLAHRKWPDAGKIVCHARVCASRLCVNPDHLYEGTHKSNAEDREALKDAA